MAWNMQQATEQMYLGVDVPIRRLFHKTLLTFQNFGKLLSSGISSMSLSISNQGAKRKEESS